MGVRLRRPDLSRWYLKGGTAKAAHHIQILSVDREQFDFVGLDENGIILSRYNGKWRRGDREFSNAKMQGTN